jgi:ABC-2 type transport system permease protein
LFEARKVSGAGEEEAVEAQDRLRQWAPVVFVYLLWISVFTVAQMLLTNTVEEKSNRIIEVLLSSISPVELMAGKIAGIALTGLTIVGSWMAVFFLGTKYIPKLLDASGMPDLSALAGDPVYIGSFLVYFLLGYLLFAAFLVGIGAVCTTLKEAQNLMGPVTLLLIVPLMSMIPIGRDPNGMLAKVMSFIPPFTPFVMMNRAAGPPTPLEYVLTATLLVLSIGAALWAAAKVFRIGILLTGKPPKLKEILRWIRAPVGVVPQRKG